MSALKEASDKFERYRAPSGLYSLGTSGTVGHETQNGALFTMECMLVLEALSDGSDGDRALLESLWCRADAAILRLEKFPGVTSRVPGGVEHDSMDNASAVMTWSAMRDGGSLSRRIRKHGQEVRCTGNSATQDPEGAKKYRWLAWLTGPFRTRRFWNCEEPSKFCLMGWHGRSPGHMAMLKKSSGRWLGPLGFLSLLVSQFLGTRAKTSDTDARKLAYVEWQWLKGTNFLWGFFYRLWCKELMKDYPNGMRDVYGIYYRDKSHPIHQYATAFEK